MIVESQGVLWSRDLFRGGGKSGKLSRWKGKEDAGGGRRGASGGPGERAQTSATFVHRLELLMLHWAGGCLG